MLNKKEKFILNDCPVTTFLKTFFRESGIFDDKFKSKNAKCSALFNEFISYYVDAPTINNIYTDELEMQNSPYYKKKEKKNMKAKVFNISDFSQKQEDNNQENELTEMFEENQTKAKIVNLDEYRNNKRKL